MKNFRIAVLCLLLLAMAGYLLSAWSAHSYGRNVKNMVMLLGKSGFADTNAMREYFDSPAMVAPLGRMRMLSYLGSRHYKRAEELRTGVIYLSEQAAFPQEQRLTSPPVLKHLVLPTKDRTDEGLARALMSLLDSY